MKEVLRERSSELHVPSSPQLSPRRRCGISQLPLKVKRIRIERTDAGLSAASDPRAERFPDQAATQVIAELEPFDRELFGALWVGVTAKVTASGW